MKVLLPLEKMSLADKINTMEVIWENLSQNEATFSSPAWHKDVLNERENNLAMGKEKILDWESTKKNIRKKLK
ncbi:MAG: hypothetical protein ACD_79C01144G0001 [uncultured bacterium]|nr:MAG: hypothetical protein ACD_79C01144G0001 [uncultured bacterium]